LGFSTGYADLGRRSRLYEIAVPGLIPEPDNQNLLHSVKPEMSRVMNLTEVDTDVTDFQPLWSPAPAR
jgi:hypothetical protein